MDRIIAHVIGYSSKRIYHHISQTEYWRTQTLRYIFSEDKSLSNIIYIRFFVFYELSVVHSYNFLFYILCGLYIYTINNRCIYFKTNLFEINKVTVNISVFSDIFRIHNHKSVSHIAYGKRTKIHLLFRMYVYHT